MRSGSSTAGVLQQLFVESFCMAMRWLPIIRVPGSTRPRVQCNLPETNPQDSATSFSCGAGLAQKVREASRIFHGLRGRVAAGRSLKGVHVSGSGHPVYDRHTHLPLCNGHRRGVPFHMRGSIIC